jgi:phosphoribosylanthranilate isomerase
MPVPLPPRLLLEGARSGAGEKADWTRAALVARRTQLVLAGGLDAGNIAWAIRTARPFGVDVSSGVESARGVKDPAMIREFIGAVRAAERAPEVEESR